MEGHHRNLPEEVGLMVNKLLSKESQGGPPPMDESWWTALLAEEEKPRGNSGSEYASLSSSRKEFRQITVNWERARRIYEEDETIRLQVTGYNRGGLLVEGTDLQGFVPISHLVNMSGEKSEEEREHLLSKYVRCSLLLKVIECDPERGRVVFSERAALSEPGSRTQLLDALQPGERTCGSVTNVTDFGVFVDLGGLEGLIHVSELSWGRVRHPSDTLKLGDRVEVYVISVDCERARVALSLKRLNPNPWETAESRYHPGQIIEATVTSILPFGAFARLEEGLDGLIHVSEMGMKGDNVKPANVLKEGQVVQVRVIQVEAARQRLGLSLLLELQDSIFPA
jgi:small subunit ribosomal protein S1